MQWIVKIGEVVDVTHGFAFKSADFSTTNDAKLPIVLTPGNFSEDARHIFSDKNTKRFTGEIPQKFLFSKGELTIVMTDLSSKMKILGKPAFVERENILHNQRIGRVIPKSDQIDQRYLYYFLQSDEAGAQIKGSATGTMVRHTAPKRILSLEIPLPQIKEQHRIVAILDDAFEGLARARGHAEANLQNARELFDAQLSAMFRKIDAGQKKPLGDVCDFVRGPFGGSLKKAIFKPSGYAVYEQQHAIRDQFEDFRYFIDDAKFAEMARFRVEAGDLIMSCSGTMGKVAIVPEDAPDGIINQALLKLRPSEELRAEFLKRWMQSDDFQDQLSANTMGVAIKNVASVKTLKTLLAVVPSLEEQANIVSRSEEAEEQFVAITQSYEAKLGDLDDLRQSLLQKAFAGELT
ncbi:MAG: restriction endonuclease subunit S [Marinovum algicola]|uniref:restriction endonuclease subunit S n=1 Tax=Marinovum algicola TaxID=42444 RepID=UPI0032EDAFA9